MSSRSTRLALLTGVALAALACDPASDPSPTLGPAEVRQALTRVGSSPTVFATGLLFPRGLAFGPDGKLYVAEAGSGGTGSTTSDQCVQVAPPIGPYTNGATGRISRIDRNGNRTTVAEGFPSGLNAIGDVSSVADVGFVDDKLYALIAGGGCSHGSADVPASLVGVRRSGDWRVAVDLSAYQASHPVAQPSEGDFEPDGAWYSMVSSGDGVIAVEANHGEVVRINPRNGNVRRIADISASFGHIVPTAIAERRGALFVSSLGIFPVVPGLQNIMRISRRGDVKTVAQGFTTVLGLAFDRCGRLYVLQTSSVAGFPTPFTGQVIRLDRRGNREVVADSLFFPTAITFGPDGKLYISSNGFGPPLPGQILRVDVPGAHDWRWDLDLQRDDDD